MLCKNRFWRARRAPAADCGECIRGARDGRGREGQDRRALQCMVRGRAAGDDEEIVIGEDTNVQDYSMRVSARWRITERFRARGTKSQVLMPTLMPTRATPDDTRRTYRSSRYDEFGLFRGFCGLHGTRWTLQQQTRSEQASGSSPLVGSLFCLSHYAAEGRSIGTPRPVTVGLGWLRRQ